MSKKYILLILAILLGLFALGGGLPKSFSSSYTGFTTASITSGASDGNNVIIYWVGDGSGGSVSGIFSPLQVQAATGFLPGQGFTLEAEVTDQKCRYQFRDTGQIIKKIVAFEKWPYIYRDTGPSCSYVAAPYKDKDGLSVKMVGQCAYANSNGQWPDCKCQISYFESVGVAYKVDSFPVNEFGMDVGIKVGDTEYITHLDNDNKEGSTNGVVHKYIGSLKGDVDCGTISSDIVAFIPKGSNTVQIKDYSLYEKVFSQEPSSYNAYSVAQGYNSIVDSFTKSTGDIGQLCEITGTETGLYDTTVRCTPIGTVGIPTVITTIPASLLKVEAPTSSWMIGTIYVNKVEAAELSEVCGDITNTGGIGASVDVSVQGPVDVSPFSSRYYLQAGETKTVCSKYAGAGLIDEFIFKANDVNNPETSAAKNVELVINPFCTFDAPGSGFEKVATAAGCNYYCGEKVYTQDVVSSTCDIITTYDRCISYTSEETIDVCRKYVVGYECISTGTNEGDVDCDYRYVYDGDVDCNPTIGSCSYPLPSASSGDEGTVKYCRESTKTGSCLEEQDYPGYHCTGIGIFTTTNKYLDRVNRGNEPFIPERREHQYFITQSDNIMVCDYVWQFGYGPDGKLDSVRADYENIPEPAQYVDYNSEFALSSNEMLGLADNVGNTIKEQIEDNTGIDFPCAGALVIVGIIFAAFAVYAIVNWRKLMR